MLYVDAMNNFYCSNETLPFFFSSCVSEAEKESPGVYIKCGGWFALKFTCFGLVRVQHETYVKCQDWYVKLCNHVTNLESTGNIWI